MTNSILSDLDNLISKAHAVKTAALKEGEDAGISGKIDNLDDGTSAATTGEQAADNMAAQRETYPEPAADVGANDNPAGESVTESTDGATAASPDGEAGAQGADMEPQKEADNGEEKPENKIAEDLTAAREFAEELRKTAEELLTPFDRFLVKAARNNDDPQVKTAAEAMADDELAAAATDTLMDQLESGEITEDEAAAILEEAIEAGAVDEADLAEATAAMEGAAGEAAPVPEEAPMLPEAGVGEEELMEAKLASVDIGPDNPKYQEKLAQFYTPELQAGYAFALKLAEEMIAEEEEEEEAAGEGEGDGEGEGEGEGGDPAAAEPFAGEETPAEEAAEGHAVVEPPPVPEPAPAPVPAEAPPVAEEVVDEVAPEPAADELAAETPEEQAALAAVQQELGLDDAQLAQLMAAEAPALDKVAEAKNKYRTAILNKVAALDTVE